MVCYGVLLCYVVCCGVCVMWLWCDCGVVWCVTACRCVLWRVAVYWCDAVCLWWGVLCVVYLWYACCVVWRCVECCCVCMVCCCVLWYVYNVILCVVVCCGVFMVCFWCANVLCL